MNDSESSFRNPLCGDNTPEILSYVFGDDGGSPSTRPNTSSSEDEEEVRSFRKLSDSDVEINYKTPLGGGAFCMVYPVYLKDSSGKFSKEKRPLALKKLRRELLPHKAQAKIAEDDLRREAQLLSKLSHVNILTVYGIRNEDGKEETGSFFMVMNLLAETLESKLDTWAKNRGRFQRNTPHETTVIDRLREVVLGIASGMEYLHSKLIVYRDLKPANIGFDASRRVKIFDFGLSVELSKDGTCTGQDGTLRYLAPEVAANTGKPYGLAVDVFSFAILLWQIVTSRIPYENEISFFNESKPQVEGKRPPMKFIESKDLQKLLEVTWAQNPAERLTFKEIRHVIQKMISKQPAAKPTPQKKRSRRILRSLFT